MISSVNFFWELFHTLYIDMERLKYALVDLGIGIVKVKIDIDHALSHHVLVFVNHMS